MGFFVTDFMTSTYSSSVSQSAQGQLSSQYEAALTNYLSQDTQADWIGFLAKSVNGLTTTQALEVKALVDAGTFSLSGLFGAAQSKTGAVDGANVTDPEPTLTVTLADNTVVTIDLKAVLSGLDTETWTYTEVNGSGKKASTTTTFHTREFYTDGHEPADYDPDWADEGGGGGGPTEHHDTQTQTIIKDNSSEPDDTFNVHFDLAGVDWSNVALTVSAQGDYDAANESVTITGDILLTLLNPDHTNVGGSPADSALNDFFDAAGFSVSASNYADGSVDLVVAFTNQVNNGSSVTLVLDYDYMA